MCFTGRLARTVGPQNQTQAQGSKKFSLVSWMQGRGNIKK